jgi:hypothetical protein
LTIVFAAYLLLQTVVHTTAPIAPITSAPVNLEGNSDGLVYLPERNAHDDVESALSDAKASGKAVVMIMGANWCHDSTGLAGRLNTPRFVDMMRDRYQIVYIDVGTPQIGKGRNLDIARRLGIKNVKNTPLVMLVSADGVLLNSKKDAASWRNAASRSEEDIFRYFAEFKPTAK